MLNFLRTVLYSPEDNNPGGGETINGIPITDEMREAGVDPKFKTVEEMVESGKQAETKMHAATQGSAEQKRAQEQMNEDMSSLKETVGMLADAVTGQQAPVQNIPQADIVSQLAQREGADEATLRATSQMIAASNAAREQQEKAVVDAKNKTVLADKIKANHKSVKDQGNILEQKLGPESYAKIQPIIADEMSRFPEDSDLRGDEVQLVYDHIIAGQEVDAGKIAVEAEAKAIERQQAATVTGGTEEGGEGKELTTAADIRAELKKRGVKGA